ncbi:hypothetical protein DDT52_18585 [Brenneria roseae subsp. roseae]|uniref:hypothetical protein n=1 Tax=Brenneria roseae TaxID=1509241 RepID=UPI000D617770|nr:hypothetical protein [Brenneria roseae]PWC16218.1 hypothetical protein DDT52_18585 [Brenneria roseae subsp. roseae]
MIWAEEYLSHNHCNIDDLRQLFIERYPELGKSRRVTWKIAASKSGISALAVVKETVKLIQDVEALLDTARQQRIIV